MLDVALDPLLVLYPQAHIPPAGTSNRLARLGLQHCAEAAHAGGVVGQWLTLRNPSTAQGHWYCDNSSSSRRRPTSTAGKTRMTRTRSAWARRASQSPPALLQGQGQEALLQGPPLDAPRRCTKGGAAKLTGPNRTAPTAG